MTFSAALELSHRRASSVYPQAVGVKRGQRTGRVRMRGGQLNRGTSAGLARDDVRKFVGSSRDREKPPVRYVLVAAAF